MRLSAQEVSQVVEKLLQTWKEAKLVSSEVSEAKIKEKLNDVFLKELQVEDDLNAEVETLLAKYEKEFDQGTLDRRKMFNMVKAQLVKDRKLVL